MVAVSGGADSTALLVGLARVAREFGLGLAAAHLHHGLRGAEADADLDSVRAICARLGVPLHAARWDTRRRMARRGWRGQEGLRRLRRAFLIGAARRANAAAIATAHTADDQLETILLRLARGAGLTGLGGMRERRGPWVKPLLELTRAEIEADLVRAGVAWREDASNLSRDYARNRVRHEVVPALIAAVAAGGRVPDESRTGGPAPAPSKAALVRAGLARRAARAAAEVRAAERALDRWVRRGLSRACRIQGGEIRLDSRGVAPYPSAARRIALRRLWSRLEGGREGLTLRHLDALLGLVRGRRPGAVVRLPGGWRAERERDIIRFRSAAVGSRAGRGGARPTLTRARALTALRRATQP
jgi:tRNA(Ile)-lysidine synthase